MGTYSRSGLARAVAQRRTQLQMTQQELATEAEYGSSGAVSVSRLETGTTLPGRERLELIARALGWRLEELESEAARLSEEDAADDVDPPSTRELKEQAKRLQGAVDDRIKVITELTKAFDVQHTRSRRDFLDEFTIMARRVRSADPSTLLEFHDNSQRDVRLIAANQLAFNTSQVLAALSEGGDDQDLRAEAGIDYETLVAQASAGATLAGAGVSGLNDATASALSGVLRGTAAGAASVASGGAGLSRAAIMMSAAVALPIAVLAAGGALLMSKRNRRQRQEFARQVAEAEAELEATSKSFEGFCEVVGRATESLDYVATHGGHAVGRWIKALKVDFDLESGSIRWQDLSAADQERYGDFVVVSAAFLAFVTINSRDVLSLRGPELETQLEVVDQVLTQASSLVEARV